MILGSFLFFLALFCIIGLLSSFVSRHTVADYYLASRTASPLVVGLSAVSTNNSGYMFIGLMGFTYLTGLSVFWLLFGWIVGDFMTSLYVYGKLRRISEERGELTFAGTVAAWGALMSGGGKAFGLVRLAIGFSSLLFLSIYAAAQLNAGGKALEALFDFPTITGAVLVAVLVAAYCIAGGLRASLWTDVAQSLVMLVSMCILALAAIAASGGVGASFSQLSAVPHYLDWFPYDQLIFAGGGFWFVGVGLFVVGWLISGFCVAGQPQIMVRFMVMGAGQLNAVRFWYYGFYVLFGLLALIVGLMTKIHLTDIALMDYELVLPTMAARLLPELMVGLMLAGVFAATMSTADSLLLSCSASLTHDLFPRLFTNKNWIKFTTMGITAFALSVAIYAQTYGGQNVFTLAQFAWAGLGSAVAPLLLLLSLGKVVSQPQALAMMALGLGTVVGWRLLGLPVIMFDDGFAGVVMSFLTYFFWRWLGGIFRVPLQTIRKVQPDY